MDEGNVRVCGTRVWGSRSISAKDHAVCTAGTGRRGGRLLEAATCGTVNAGVAGADGDGAVLVRSVTETPLGALWVGENLELWPVIQSLRVTVLLGHWSWRSLYKCKFMSCFLSNWRGVQSAFLAFDVPQLSSIQNNGYAQGACFGVA